MNQLLIQILDERLELNPAGRPAFVDDPDAPGKLKVTMILASEWKKEGENAPDAPLHVLDELVTGVEAAIDEAQADEDEEGVDYKRKTKRAVVIAIGDPKAESADDYTQFNARVASVRVQGSAKRVKVEVKLVFGGVDPDGLRLLGSIRAVKKAKLENPQGDLFASAA